MLKAHKEISTKIIHWKLIYQEKKPGMQFSFLQTLCGQRYLR